MKSRVIGVLHTAVAVATLFGGMSVFSTQATASLILQNGSFESVSGASASFSINNPTSVSGWNVTPIDSNSLDCLVLAGASTNMCGTVAFGGGLTFWVNPGPSPDGGNYIAIDGDTRYSTPLTQTMSGLTPGAQYDVIFWQAATQQHGFNGATTERWQVNFGSASQSSTLMNNLSHGSVGWMSQTLTFTAATATDLLSFVAIGTPNGVPPFVLLDGVSVHAASGVPEPATSAMLGIGLLGLPIIAKLLKKRQRSA